MILSLKEVFDPALDNQRVFRLVLDCMARPGKVNYLPDIGFYVGKEYSFLSLIAKAFMDIEVSFTYLGLAKRNFIQEITRCTGAKVVDVQNADFIFCDGRERQNDLCYANRRTLECPDSGPTVIMGINHLFDQKPWGRRNLARVELVSPSDNDSRQIWIAGVHYDNLDWLLQQNQIHPFGMDIILVDMEGKVTCVPRNTNPKWELEWN